MYKHLHTIKNKQLSDKCAQYFIQYFPFVSPNCGVLIFQLSCSQIQGTMLALETDSWIHSCQFCFHQIWNGAGNIVNNSLGDFCGEVCLETTIVSCLWTNRWFIKLRNVNLELRLMSTKNKLSHLYFYINLGKHLCKG